jgi:predicted unusual protein kinase regulating ubiquinone biosynthesis (AarF/ABC1/UbiB family)
MQFLPGVVRELIKHVPSLAFEITDWGTIRRDLPMISSRLFTGVGIKELIAAQDKQIHAFVSFVSKTSPAQRQDRKAKGDALLKYYFAQLYVKEGIFLDLRDTRLNWNGKALEYEPTGLWYRFSDSFRHGLIELYEGFYFGDEAKFESGLVATGLLQRTWPIEDQNEVKNLFRSHFGGSLEHPMSFDLSHFQETFLKLFQFLLRKKVKLSSEFMIFGVFLVTLYLSLEGYQSSHAVKSLFLEVHHALAQIKPDQKQ